MKKTAIILALIVLGLAITGCMPEEKTPTAPADESVEDISEEVAEIDSTLDGELAELDQLDQELAELESLDLG
ncbi:hypothetical protein GF358_01265 [Candidatus Woesearchaeota archaeon]|nr:hypothetical protein [Candidatus Woesearchaeota archaeon]